LEIWESEVARQENVLLGHLQVVVVVVERPNAFGGGVQAEEAPER